MTTNSTLYRLLTYSSAPQNDARENFTTEALAGAIRHDPEPMLRALRGAEAVGEGATVTAVHTQVSVAGTGIIDLVLEISTAGRPSTVWIEVKVDAGESGNQLGRYVAYIAAHRDHEMRLLVLARAAVGGSGVRLMTWQSVRDAARGSKSPFWKDFTRFLEEIHMADDYDAPVTATEAAALSPSVGLARKVERIVRIAAEHANKAAPGWSWPTDSKDVRSQLADQLVNHGRYVIANRNRGPAWCFFGVIHTADVAELCVVMEARPKPGDVRRRVHAAARDLGERWERPSAGWPVLVTKTPLLAHSTHDAAAKWLCAAIDDLKQCDLFAANGQPPSAEAETEYEPEDP